MRGVPVDQLSPKQEQAVHQLSIEMLDSTELEPFVDPSRDLRLGSELLRPRFDPPFAVEERTSVDLHQEITIPSKSGKHPIASCRVMGREVDQKGAPGFTLSQVPAAVDMDLAPQRVERDHSEHEGEVRVPGGFRGGGAIRPGETSIETEMGPVGESSAGPMRFVERSPGGSDRIDARNHFHRGIVVGSARGCQSRGSFSGTGPGSIGLTPPLDSEQRMPIDDLRIRTDRRDVAADALTASMFAVLFVAILLARPGSAMAAPPEKSMRGAMVAFIETLPESQRDVAVAPINAPDRGRWTYLAGPRTGLRIGDLDETARSAFDRFLDRALSPKGRDRVREILRVEPVEDRGGGVRTGPGEYWIRIHGDPTADGSAWAWRLEGHHLVLNTAVVDERIVSVTPFFLGASPARHPKFGEPLAIEDQAAATFLASLDPILAATANGIGPAPGDIRSGTTPDARRPDGRGLRGDRLTEPQRAALEAIVFGLLDFWPEASTGHLRERWRAQDPARIDFGWAGAGTRSGPHYWRIDSPVLLVEFSNTSPSFDHAHLVLRTPGDEFPGR